MTFIVRALAYIRVSSREQDEQVQRRALEEFASERGIEVVKWYVDKGESGAKPFRSRPSASRLLAELEQLKPEAIVVWSIDRLGRTMLDTLSTILDFEDKGVKVISVKEEWMQALDSNVRKLILSIISWVAEFERKRIRERQEEAWRAGKQKGRPPKVRDEIIRRYLERYLPKGLSLMDIWRILKGDGFDIHYETFRRRANRLLELKLKRKLS